MIAVPYLNDSIIFKNLKKLTDKLFITLKILANGSANTKKNG